MKKYLFIFLIFIFFTCRLFSQSHFTSVGLDIGSNLLIGDSKISNSQVSPNLGGFFTYKFSDFFSLKLQAGYGKLNVDLLNENYTTSFFPVELTGLFALRQSLEFTPFIHIGIGAIAFKRNDWQRYYDGIFIGGVGFTIPISTNFSLMTTADVKYTTGDDFNGINGGLKDGYFSLQTGIAYNFKNSKKFERKDKLPKFNIIAQRVEDPETDNKSIELEKPDRQMPKKETSIKVSEEKSLSGENEVITENKFTLVLQGINFAFDSAVLNENTKNILNKTADILKSEHELQIEIQGYACSTGDSTYNERLSERRAEEVKEYFIKQGINSEQLIIKGYGERNPIASNDTIEGRAKNRRVEFINLNDYRKISTLFSR